MAIEYTLYVGFPSAESEIQRLIAEAWTASIDGMHVPSRRLMASVWSEPDTDEMIEKSCGVAPSTRVFFTMHKGQDYDLADADMLEACLAVLRATPYDVALTRDEQMLLLRRQGNTLIANDEFWRPELLDLVNILNHEERGVVRM